MKLLIIYTGGTIGMIEDPETGALRPFNFDHLIENVPKIRMLNYQIDNVQFPHPIDSSDMNTHDWKVMAELIEKHYNDYDGFVVLHGTDTMAYTASALSFMLRGLTKPVIITGSQLPIGEVRTDGEENLITALQITAAKNHKGEPMVQEVAILFENYLWRGNRSTKMSADNFNAFKSNNYPPLAKIGLGIHFNEEAMLRPQRQQPLELETSMDNSVLFIDLFPGLNRTTLEHMLHTPNLRGVVLKTYGAGNGPTSAWFLEPIEDAIKRGIIVVNVSQCVNGGILCSRYVGGSKLAAIGVINGKDMTCEAAITKMMYLLGQKNLCTEQVKSLMGAPICGELSVHEHVENPLMP